VHPVATFPGLRGPVRHGAGRCRLCAPRAADGWIRPGAGFEIGTVVSRLRRLCSGGVVVVVPRYGLR
jgi:hypothetical protein